MHISIVMTSIQMKFEHLRIIFEAKVGMKPFGILCDGTVCLNTELGLHEMRMHYLNKCEAEQCKA